MSIATLVLGQSGTGKSTSMRNLNPKETLLIQTIKKPLPFKSNGWAIRTKDNLTGNIFVTDSSDQICQILSKTQKKIIVIDDWNLTMTNEYMRRSSENGFNKFAEIGKNAWNIMTASSQLNDDVRVYMLGHTETNEFGQTKAKTIGKMIDQTCPVESMFSIVIKATIINDRHIFSTKNDGQDTTKTPIDMFKDTHIDNDLKYVDNEICNYYGITLNA